MTTSDVEFGEVLDELLATQERLNVLTQDNAILNAHVTSLIAKLDAVSEHRDQLQDQVAALADELAAAEACATPPGTRLVVTYTDHQLATDYRTLARTTRGPIPRAAYTALDADADRILAETHRALRGAVVASLRRHKRRAQRAATRR